MDEHDVSAAMRWAERSGEFVHHQLQEFHELIRLLQEVSVPVSELSAGRQLDSGAFGSIEKALYHGSKVAVKYVKADGGKALPQMFREVKLELTIIKQLRHPSIVTFMGAAVKFNDRGHKSDWTLGLIFELCEGGQLNKMLHNPDNTVNHRFSNQDKLGFAKDIAIGVSYLHSLRIIHRDLSTRNLLLTVNKKVKICDFGCARKVVNDDYQSTTISGSPPWMAPEQIKGEGLSLKADVFSFGTILWELATEKIPHFEVSDNLAALTEAITVHGLRPKVPGPEHMVGLPDSMKRSLCRLISLLHKTTPCLRPSAEQTLEVITSMEEALNPTSPSPNSPQKEKIGQPHYSLVKELEDRADLGERLFMFYQRYNPDRVRTVAGLLDQFAGKENELNAEMRSKYNADLNGDYRHQVYRSAEKSHPRAQVDHPRPVPKTNASHQNSSPGSSGSITASPPTKYTRRFEPEKHQEAKEVSGQILAPNGRFQRLRESEMYREVPMLDEIGAQIMAARLQHFFSKHDPLKMSDVHGIIATFKDRPDDLKRWVRETYGYELEDPEGLLPRPQQAAREPERLQLVPNPGVEEFRMVEIQRDMPYVGPARDHAEQIHFPEIYYATEAEAEHLFVQHDPVFEMPPHHAGPPMHQEVRHVVRRSQGSGVFERQPLVDMNMPPPIQRTTVATFHETRSGEPYGLPPRAHRIVRRDSVPGNAPSPGLPPMRPGTPVMQPGPSFSIPNSPSLGSRVVDGNFHPPLNGLSGPPGIIGGPPPPSMGSPLTGMPPLPPSAGLLPPRPGMGGPPGLPLGGTGMLSRAPSLSGPSRVPNPSGPRLPESPMTLPMGRPNFSPFMRI